MQVCAIAREDPKREKKSIGIGRTNKGCSTFPPRSPIRLLQRKGFEGEGT